MHRKTNLLIIGGGIFGCSIAYYYSRNNANKEVTVIERNELCNAATSRAAALMNRIRPKKAMVPLSSETYKVVPELEHQLGESLGMKQVGMLHVAASESSVAALSELMKIAEEFGDEAMFVSNEKAHAMAPWLRADDALQIGFMPKEAYCDPYLLGTFYARCAKMQGAKFYTGVDAEALILDDDRVVGVQTSEGFVEADVVIIASGAWAPIHAAQAGIGLPMAPVRSQYWITERSNIFPEDSPMVLLPDANTYARPESGGLLFGIRERKSFAMSPKDIPSDISGLVLSNDRGQNDLSELIDKIARFFPSIHDIGLKYYITGFSCYTPDNFLAMGKAPNINNLLLATGCVGAGISTSGGVGLAFAEMAAGRENPFDFSAFDVTRFGEVDPFSIEWLERCALARSVKKSA